MVKPNPYIILGIKKTATDSEIRLALKSKINTFCGNDLNNKDIEGNYLFQMYKEAATMLLDKNTREEIDRILASEKDGTSLMVKETIPSIKIETKEDFLAYINIELFKSNAFGKIKKAGKDDSEVWTDGLYLMIGEDNSFIFVYQSYELEMPYSFNKSYNVYRLKSIFTQQVVVEEKIKYYTSSCPRQYFDGKIFSVCGVKSFIIPACKIIPAELIKEYRIKRSDLIDLQNAIQYASRERPDIIKEAFKSKYL